MASTNAGSLYYISRPAGTEIEYFDTNPSPTPIFSEAKRDQISEACRPGIDGVSTVVPGRWVKADAGAHESGKTLIINCGYMLEATRTVMLTKYHRLENVYFSPDDGVTKYELQWKSFTTTRLAGRKVYSAVFEFDYIQDI